ncbi:hypothetical protein [Novosphingobium naphthalenivorans]|uniref:hypothetical protein n=1 Tax=Novosphingobium naphthalenivorans TaxID=273168 RepID=UPI000A5AC7A4|nr:hypothetical protein [Novosphingobium naphthalenivorans]
MFNLTRENLKTKTDAQLRDLFAQALRHQTEASCRTAFNSTTCVIRMIGNELAQRNVAPR